jgi:protein-disulfide isomerase
MEKEDKPRQINVPAAIIIAGFLIAIAIIASPAVIRNSEKKSGLTKENGARDPAATIPPPQKDEHRRGSAEAPFVFVEYSDLECPFCKQFHSVMQQATKEYPDKVAWVYRHFPLNIHPRAFKEAEAAECAAELGGNEAFWRFVDSVFERTPGNNRLDPALLPEIAVQVGLNREAFGSCLDSGRHADLVARQADEAIAGGAGGTPFTVIFGSGKFIGTIPGALPWNTVETIIQSLDKPAATTGN